MWNRVNFQVAAVPILDNPRWEKFAVGVVAGQTQRTAYVHAGGKANKNAASEASKLIGRPEVRKRIAELQIEAAKDAKVSLHDIIVQLDADWKLAHISKQPGAAVGATMGKAKLLGFVIDRAEVEATLRKPARRATTDKKISLDEWKQKFQPKLDAPEEAG